MKVSARLPGEVRYGGARAPVIRYLIWLLVGRLLSAPLLAGGRTDDPGKGLTPAQRAQLEKEAEKLNHQAVRLYGDGLYKEATRLLERALAVRQRLYPEKDFPRGHLDLATSLNNLGALLRADGEYGKALQYYERALAMSQKLYPEKDFPRGHLLLAGTLNNLGALFVAQGEYRKALRYHGRALALREQIYLQKDYPRGHPDLANSLNNLGALFDAQGEYRKALHYYGRALAMCQKLYPQKDYPGGHPHLAGILNNLGGLFDAQGEYGKALSYYERTLAMYQKLYSEKDYPRGHPDLATSLNNLGLLFQSRGEYAKAGSCYQQALAMYQKLYAEKDYPRGHPLLATSLNNLGSLFAGQGDFARALGYYERALAMRQRLYPEKEYSRGHPELADSLNNVGILLQDQGDSAKALPYVERALMMNQNLYPRTDYPSGHPDLAGSLDNLGDLFEARGHHGKALGYHERALAMNQGLLRHFGELVSEAEALGMAATFPLTRDAVLSVSARVPRSDARVYQHVWQSKAVLTRILERRHLALLATSSRGARDKWQALLDARRHIDRALALPSRDDAARDRELRELTERKERLERELAELLPQLPRRQELDELGPASLRKRLPARTAFVDLLRYTRFDFDASKPGNKGERRTDCYVAFVLLPGQAARRVHLGPAEPIETALAAWRQAIEEGKDGEAARIVRRLVWQPIRRNLPEQTKTVYLSPDGDLTRLPWAALPGDKDGSVLLEEYTLAVVPHGPFLLERLLFPAKPACGPGLLLAAGGIRYGDQPRPKQGYEYLPGTEGELRQVVALAGRRPTVALDGEAATVARLTTDLSRARWAHLATHGFFDEATYREEQQRIQRVWETWRFQATHTTEQVGLRVRSPLGFTGLVLAGANQHDHGDSGILTGEGLVELRLEGLE
ncbi:MAG TPA: tetratricopeptide repeat protein, partial [Gemmataceae bacterium]|nr:tetratricopeptide repeat protein [Gemmataceae bacterium]